LVASSSPECMQTINEIETKNTPHKKTYSDLRDIDYGTLRGCYIADLQKQDDKTWKQWKYNTNEFISFPEGESLQGFQKRVLRTFAEIASDYNKDKNILIVT